jgi:Transposase IS116/IS110/IS902 family
MRAEPARRNDPCRASEASSSPRLLAEALDALQRRDYHAMRCLCGAAPVTKRSGRSRIILMRQAAHVRLRTAVYHWAASPYSTTKEAGSNTPLFGAKATVMPAPLRSVADRVLAVACAMLTNQTDFNPNLAAKGAKIAN